MKLVTEATTEELEAEIARRKEAATIGVRMLINTGKETLSVFDGKKKYHCLAHPSDMRIDRNGISVLVAAEMTHKDSTQIDLDRLALECSLAPCMADFAKRVSRIYASGKIVEPYSQEAYQAGWLEDQLTEGDPSNHQKNAARAAGWIA